MSKHAARWGRAAARGLGVALLLVAAPVWAEPMSTLFPYCWQGNENSAVFYAEGLMTRQLVLYANSDEQRPLTKVELILDLPLGAAELVYAVACDGPGRLKAGAPVVVGPGVTYDPNQPRLWKTPVARGTREGMAGDQFAHYVIPLWDIRPGYRWRGKTPWSEWPGSWTALYIKGQKPGNYAVYWQLRAAEGSEPERMAPLQVLARPASPSTVAARPGGGIGVWVNSLSMYGDFPPVAHGLAGTLKACGVRRVYLTARQALSVGAAHAAGLQAFLTNPWPRDAFAPTEPPGDDYRARDAKGTVVPGNAWCPTYVAWGGDQWEAAVTPSVTGDVKSLGADGYMLDCETVGAPGRKPCELCFCERCHQAFVKELGAAVNWPGDVRPGGRYYQRWLRWRQEQVAWYVKRIADLARVANPQAEVFIRSQGCYEPYPDHQVYTANCTDLALLARPLTAATVEAITYPNHADEAFADNCDFGTDPANFGRALPDMIDLVRDTVQRLAPRPVVACLAGAPPPFAPASPLATTGLLRWQAVNDLLDGAAGLDFWGIGPCEDGRYLSLLAELAGLCGLLEQTRPGEALPSVAGIEADARRWRAARLQTATGPQVLLLNGDATRRQFRLTVGGEGRTAVLQSGECQLVAEQPTASPPAVNTTSQPTTAVTPPVAQPVPPKPNAPKPKPRPTPPPEEGPEL